LFFSLFLLASFKGKASYQDKPAIASDQFSTPAG
jgi:hypothetical protein